MVDAGVEHAWRSLPEPLAATLARSFTDRLAGEPLARAGVDNAWYGGRAPRSVVEAVAELGPMGLNVVCRVYERMRDIDPSHGLWGEIRYLRNVWWGGSAGFKVVWRDPVSARDRLRALAGRVVPDRLIGALEHQRGAAIRGMPEAVADALLGAGVAPPDCDTYREVDRVGGEALHLCVARWGERPTALDDVHIDWCSPVVGVRAGTGHVEYAYLLGAYHWAQAMFGVGKPVFAFDAVEAAIARRPAAAEWREVRWSLAVRGRAGHEEAVRWWRERVR